MRISDLPRQLQLQLYIELKILGIPVPDESDEFPPDIKEVAEVTDFWPYVEQMGFTHDEYAEILKSRSKVEELQIEDPENSRWVDAFPMGEYLILQLDLVKKRLTQAKGRVQEFEREIQRNPNNQIAIENLNYFRSLVWHLVRSLRLSTGGGLQDVYVIQDSSGSLTDVEILSNQIGVLQKKIISLRDENLALKAKERVKTGQDKDLLKKIIDQTRKKNGWVNYSAVARALHLKTGQTAKTWIENQGLLEYAEQN